MMQRVPVAKRQYAETRFAETRFVEKTMKACLTILLLLAASTHAHAQGPASYVVYGTGGDGTTQQVRAAQAALHAALQARGSTTEAGQGGCEPDAGCLAALLREHGVAAAAVATYWQETELRESANFVVTLADGEGLVAAARDVGEGDDMEEVAGELVEQALADWPRRSGVTLFLDTDPTGAPVRIDGAFVQSPVVRPLALGRHEIFVGTDPAVRRELVVDGSSDEEIHLQIELHPDDAARRVIALRDVDGQGDGEQEHEVETPSTPSAWPSYVIGGAAIAAGAAMWIPPAVTLARSGECESGCDTAVREEVAMSGGQWAMGIAGSVLVIGGVVLMATTPIKVGGSASPDGASLSLSGSF